ncbi:MAG TPA: ribosome biogenesis GTPase Der [Terriglobia bacterium]|nr:ribosome biogenesis GTPase Der [Terriglobia bacterium]
MQCPGTSPGNPTFRSQSSSPGWSSVYNEGMSLERRQPVVVIVGRPNVGKSTLFNRITRSRRAIVGDEPGITRDRIYGQAEWLGKRFELVDTGGMLVGESAEIPARIVEQARVAIEEACYVILVVDGRSELTAADQELARLLRRTGKPVVLAVNKMDTEGALPAASEFYRLGIAPVIPISAEHSRGVDDLLEVVTAGLPEPAGAATETEERPVSVAIIGRPNVGKSTLLNQLVGDERSIVSEIPGTTRDAVDTIVEREGHRYRLVDTAGIRRKGKTRLMAEKLSVVMARRHIRLSDIALLLIDATEGITALDATIGGYAHEEGTSVIVLINKWDLVKEKRKTAEEIKAQAQRKLKFLEYAPRLFISAQSGLGMAKVFPEIQRVAAARSLHIPTAELNRFLHSIDFERATSPAAKKPKIYYMTQAAGPPPRFILFTDKGARLHFSFERFLINQLRKKYGFAGTPITLQLRPHKQ